jgi:hypothetical protein
MFTIFLWGNFCSDLIISANLLIPFLSSIDFLKNHFNFLPVRDFLKSTF